MKSAASTFAAIREAGSPADSATSQVIHAVIFPDLVHPCAITDHERRLPGPARQETWPRFRVVAASSHNHTIPMIDIGADAPADAVAPENGARKPGRELWTVSAARRGIYAKTFSR